jgi:hypothetical protein
MARDLDVLHFYCENAREVNMDGQNRNQVRTTGARRVPKEFSYRRLLWFSLNFLKRLSMRTFGGVRAVALLSTRLWRAHDQTHQTE